MADDMRSSIMMVWKRLELSANRAIVSTNVWEEHEVTILAQRFQREEEKTDEMANTSDCHCEELRKGREKAVARIEAYHKNIDNCDEKIKDWKTTTTRDQKMIRRSEH